MEAGKEMVRVEQVPCCIWGRAKKRPSLTRLVAPWFVWRVIQWGPLADL